MKENSEDEFWYCNHESKVWWCSGVSVKADCLEKDLGL